MTKQGRIHIRSLTSEGEGIGSLDGFKLFVEGALPEEIVDVFIVEKRKNYGKARIQNIVLPSPHRIKPICPIFNSCGGCQIMHLAYNKQLEAKRIRVIDAMDRIAHLKHISVNSCIASPHPFAYRNKIQLPLCFEHGEKKIGLFHKGSHEIIPLEKCYIHCDEGEKILEKIVPLINTPSLRYLIIKNAITTQESLIILVTKGSHCLEIKRLAKEIISLAPDIKGVIENINQNDDSVIFSKQFCTLEGRSYIYEELHTKRFRISAPSFFQVNTLQTMHLISFVIEQAELTKEDIVLDAYCGVGTFSLFGADKAGSVIGTEVVPHAIADAKENRRLNHAINTSFHIGKAEDLMPSLPHFDTVFLNPPRKGCDPSLIDELIKRQPKKIVYISCDPATLARDIHRLHKESGYHITSIQPFDMFPQTMHVETVVTLKNQI